MKTEIERDAHFQAARAELEAAMRDVAKASGAVAGVAEDIVARAVEREHRFLAAVGYLFHEMGKSPLPEAKAWLAGAKRLLAGEAT